MQQFDFTKTTFHSLSLSANQKQMFVFVRKCDQSKVKNFQFHTFLTLSSNRSFEMLLFASLTKDNMKLIVLKNVSEEPAGFLSPALSPLLQLRTNKQQSVRCYNFKQERTPAVDQLRSAGKKYNILQYFQCHFYYLRFIHSLKCLIRESINYFSSLIRENKIYYQDNNCWLSPHCSDQS